MASPLGRTFNGTTVTLDGGRDNWFGSWSPPGLVEDDDGTIPTEVRQQPAPREVGGQRNCVNTPLAYYARGHAGVV